MQLLGKMLEWFRDGLSGNDYLLALAIFWGMLVSSIIMFQRKKQGRLNRAIFVEELMEKMRKDQEIQEFMYKIQKNEEWFHRDFYKDEEMVKRVQNVLEFLNYLCYMEEAKVLPRKEYAIFEYMVLKIGANRSFQNYMYHLYHNSEKENTVFPFYYLLDRCAEKMPGGFLDKDSSNYLHI